MPEFPRKDFQLHVGWRTIKTAVSAMLVAIVYCLIGRNPAFALHRRHLRHGVSICGNSIVQNGGNPATVRHPPRQVKAMSTQVV